MAKQRASEGTKAPRAVVWAAGEEVWAEASCGGRCTPPGAGGQQGAHLPCSPGAFAPLRLRPGTPDLVAQRFLLFSPGEGGRMRPQHVHPPNL